MSSSSIKNKHQLFEIAASQYGLFTAKQAIEAGFKKNNHPYHVRIGNWVREWHGCHIVPNLLTNANKYSTMHGDEILTK